MCVRLSPSHPAARIVVGLYIFLATFLIGFFCVNAVSLLSKFKSPHPESPYDLVEATPTLSTPLKIEGPVTIEYVFMEPVDGHFEVVFRITNAAPYPVQFLKERKSCLLYEGASPGTYISGPVTCSIKPNNLKPFQSTILRATSYIDSSHYWLNVNYRVENSPRDESANLFVTHVH
jgi:hypothetical protein